MVFEKKSYSNHEEGIYWGPVTLEEKKRDVLRKRSVKYIKNRGSISCDPTFVNDREKRHEEIISAGNSSVDIDANMSGNQDFIGKLAEVLEITTIKDCEIDQDIKVRENVLMEDEINRNNKSSDSSISVIDISSDFDSSDQSLELSTSSSKQDDSLGVYPLGNLHKNLEIIEEIDEDNLNLNSDLKIEEFDCRENTDDEESINFDNTLEAMEKLLDEAMNYEQAEKLEEKEINTIQSISSPKFTPKIPSTFNSVIPIRTPQTPLFPKEKIINKLTPLTKSLPKDRFKNIKSPVATYIKNSGKTPLILGVTQKKRPTPLKYNKENVNTPKLPKKVPEANFDSFPNVQYKPAKQKLMQSEEFKLPQNINALIPLKTNIVHHRERIGKKQPNQNLEDGDLTMKGDLSGEISILDRKNALI